MRGFFLNSTLQCTKYTISSPYINSHFSHNKCTTKQMHVLLFILLFFALKPKIEMDGILLKNIRMFERNIVKYWYFVGVFFSSKRLFIQQKKPTQNRTDTKVEQNKWRHQRIRGSTNCPDSLRWCASSPVFLISPFVNSKPVKEIEMIMVIW